MTVAYTLRRTYPRRLVPIILLLIMVAAPFIMYGRSSAVLLSFRHLQLSDSTISATGVKYAFSFNTNTSGPIGSLSFSICSNYMFDNTTSCVKPAGFDASTATLSAQTGLTDFSLNGASDDHNLIVNRPAATVVSPQQLQLEFSGLTNPSAIGSYYVRVASYASVDASGPEMDYGIMVFATNVGIGITTEVPPYLLFCTGITIDGYNCGTAAGSFISFGELSSQSPKVATSQLLASTNAPYGYSVTLAGQTMTAGNNIIPAMTGNASLPGSSQFGLNARYNSGPNIGDDPQGPGVTVPAGNYNTPNKFRFVSGDIIASSNNTDDYRKLTVSYVVNKSAAQPAGNYVATISYICLANF